MSVDRYEEEVLKPGDAASKYAHGICEKTYDYNGAVHVIPLQRDNFRGRVGYSLKADLLRLMLNGNYNADNTLKDKWKLIQLLQNDGTGGKPQFSALVNTLDAYRRIGHDLVAMGADDLLGALPTLCANQIDCKYINETNLPYFMAAMDGYLDALELAGMVNVTGETAVLRDQLTVFCDTGGDDQLIFTWNTACEGVLHYDQNLVDRVCVPEMPIVGFIERGYRCNGGGWLTNLSLSYYGGVDAIRDNAEAMAFIDALTAPSVIHCKMLAEATGWRLSDATFVGPQVDIVALAHISGSGARNIEEALTDGIGAHLDKMPTPVDAILQAQEMSWADQVPEDLRLTDEKGPHQHQRWYRRGRCGT